MVEAVCEWPCFDVDLRVGSIITFKGRLDAVRWGTPAWSGTGPSLEISFPDWSIIHVSVCAPEVARRVTIPLGRYVTLKARVVDEDSNLEAIAIWEFGCGPILLTPKVSGDLTESDPT